MFGTEITVKVKQIRDVAASVASAVLPAYATPGSAGMDLCASLPEKILIQPGERVKVPTGLAIELPGSGVVALICARSGLAAKHGLTLTNAVGVIDSDYRGEIQVLMINLGGEPVTLRPGERIAQILFAPVFTARIVETRELADSQRGAGGFGSTGR
ncbi:MAG: dUTP diphosphatase [Peptococcaceae bacterium]|jgi:dUTP pyrophosphatase|nr:dUTP diphosphatase [Peptococcaceae bacterium]